MAQYSKLDALFTWFVHLGKQCWYAYISNDQENMWKFRLQKIPFNYTMMVNQNLQHLLPLQVSLTDGRDAMPFNNWKYQGNLSPVITMLLMNFLLNSGTMSENMTFKTNKSTMLTRLFLRKILQTEHWDLKIKNQKICRGANHSNYWFCGLCPEPPSFKALTQPLPSAARKGFHINLLISTSSILAPLFSRRARNELRYSDRTKQDLINWSHLFLNAQGNHFVSTMSIWPISQFFTKVSNKAIYFIKVCLRIFSSNFVVWGQNKNKWPKARYNFRKKNSYGSAEGIKININLSYLFKCFFLCSVGSANR